MPELHRLAGERQLVAAASAVDLLHRLRFDRRWTRLMRVPLENVGERCSQGPGSEGNSDLRNVGRRKHSLGVGHLSRVAGVADGEMARHGFT